MTSPAPGAFATDPVTFAWSAAAGASDYWLDVGTALGLKDLFSQDAKLATSQAVSGLPHDASTIYVRLWTAQGNPPNVTWDFNDYTYKATGIGKAYMIAPNRLSTLGASTTFEWGSAPAATAYWLDVGTAEGQNNLFSQNVGLATHQSVGGIPTDNSTIYVRLWTVKGAPPNVTWDYYDCSYQTSAVREITSPTPGSTLSGSSVTFTWSSGNGVTSAQLNVGTSPGQSDIFWQNVWGVTSQTVSGIPTDGSTVYVRLDCRLPGDTNFRHKDYTYTAAGGFADGRR